VLVSGAMTKSRELPRTATQVSPVPESDALIATERVKDRARAGDIRPIAASAASTIPLEIDVNCAAGTHRNYLDRVRGDSIYNAVACDSRAM
jgi:hypothetical protein